MPRRTPDKGVKPFEYRTGVANLPALGGIFRAGDPATIPPHKHHQVINARITPGGLFSRPGLASEYNTGIEECIQGITEFTRFGGGFMIWPGCTASQGNGNGPEEAVSMRLVFPLVSNVYSEYVFFVDGDLDPVACAVQPIVDFSATYLTGPPIHYATAPFIHDGQVHFWKTTDAGIIECWRVAMPEAAGVQGEDRYRHRCCSDLDGDTDPSYVAPAVCPPGSAWPHGHPISIAEKVFELPDPAVAFGASFDASVAGAISVAERSDEVLDGAAVVRESLYVLVAAVDPGAPTVTKTKLYRWNGVTRTEETVTFDDFDTATDGREYTVEITGSGSGSGLCVFFGGAAATGGVAWMRDDDGIWADTPGLVITATPEDFFPKFGFHWAGVPYFLGLSAAGGATYALYLAKWNGTDFELDRDISALLGSEISFVSHVVQVGPSLYILAWGDGTASFVPTAVIHYDIPSEQVIGILTINPGADADAFNQYLWLQASSTSVYLGGKFSNDVVLQAPELEECHAIYDVTDTTAPGVLYRVYASDQLEYDGITYSQGALPLIPASEGTGERAGNLFGAEG